MIRYIFLVILLFISTDSFAVAVRGAPKKTITYAKFYAYRKVQICYIPDPQNQSSQDDQAGSIDTCIATNQCLEPYCTKSPYCSGNWANTGRILYRNQMYALINRYDKVDWTQIRGRDTSVRSFLNGAPEGWHCDAIVGLGDVTDIDDSRVQAEPTYSSLTTSEKIQWDTAFDGWGIVAESGIPHIIIIGNHDPYSLFQQLLSNVRVTSQPFFYSIEPTRLTEYAIKFHTNAGIDFCIISMSSSSTHDTAIIQNSTERNYVAATIGCGSGLPTILAGHEYANGTAVLAFSGGTPTGGTNLFTIVGDSNNSEVLQVAGGHYAPPAFDPGGVRETLKHPGAGGFDYSVLNTNFQEINRHNDDTSSLPEGVTPSDGGGDYITVVTFDPRYNTMTTASYSPYWQGKDPGFSGYIAPSVPTETVLFDTRFPPP